MKQRYSWLHRLIQCAKDECGYGGIVGEEYNMMIFFVMVAMCVMLTALDKTLAGSFQVSITALTSQVNQNVINLESARDDLTTAIISMDGYHISPIHYIDVLDEK